MLLWAIVLFRDNKGYRQKVAVVSGATGGIGRILCHRLRQRGYRVVGLSRRESLSSETICVDCMVTCDLTDAATIDEAARTIRHICGGIDLFVFCAGTISPQPVADLRRDAVMEQIQINLVGVMLLTKAILPTMVKGSHIIYTNSMAAIFPLADSSVYTASKFGLRGFALALGQELRPRNIRVSSIFPGSVDTAMLRTEMEQGGSVLNFMSVPCAPETIAEWILVTAAREHAENFPSTCDRIFCDLFLWFPFILRLCLPFMTVWSRVGRARYRRRCLKNRSAGVSSG